MNPRFATYDDADLIQSICSDPEVRRWVDPFGKVPFDVSRWLTPTNMVVLVDHGCFLSNWLGDTTFGVHTNILPEGRGKRALVSARAALTLAFLRSNAESFLTSVPENNRAAAWFTRAMGFQFSYSQPKRWVARDGNWDIDHFRLDIDTWILQGHVVSLGQAFHLELEAVGHTSHAPDFVHDCYVGALCGMVAVGKWEKGLKIYNRWARSAGFVPLVVTSKNPLTLDARDFLVSVVDGKMNLTMKESEHA